MTPTRRGGEGGGDGQEVMEVKAKLQAIMRQTAVREADYLADVEVPPRRRARTHTHSTNET